MTVLLPKGTHLLANAQLVGDGSSVPYLATTVWEDGAPITPDVMGKVMMPVPAADLEKFHQIAVDLSWCLPKLSNNDDSHDGSRDRSRSPLVPAARPSRPSRHHSRERSPARSRHSNHSRERSPARSRHSRSPGPRHRTSQGRKRSPSPRHRHWGSDEKRSRKCRSPDPASDVCRPGYMIDRLRTVDLDEIGRDLSGKVSHYISDRAGVITLAGTGEQVYFHVNQVGKIDKARIDK